jgi:hypothetical protein
VLAHGALLLVLVGARDVLEELLDKIDVREDHTTAAVALEADGVEGLAGVEVLAYWSWSGMRGARWFGARERAFVFWRMDKDCLTPL